MLTSTTNRSQSTSPQVNMQDSMNVNQPNVVFQGNETIIEETNEADESVLMQNTRFS